MNLLSATNPTGYVLDVVILIGLFIFVFICAKRGFINIFFSFISSIVALFAAIALAGVVVSLTGGLFGLETSLAESFTETVSKIDGFNVNIAGSFAENDLSEMLSTNKIPAIIATLVAKKYVGVDLAPGTTLASLVGGTIAELLCSLIAGVVLFILVKLLIKLLKKVFNAITKKIGLLNKLNRILGMLVGFIEGILIISLVMSVLALIPSESITAFFNSSLILKLLYNHNPIVVMLGWFL